MTFHPRLSKGIEVITWGSHDELTPFWLTRVNLRRTLREAIWQLPRLGTRFRSSGHSPAELEKIRRNLVKGAQLKAQMGEWLAADPWDFFLIVFGECHRGGHIYGPGARRFHLAHCLTFTAALIERLGRLLEAFGERASVYLFALHGMGSNTSQEHFSPRIIDLVNRPFRQIKRGPAGAEAKQSGAMVAPTRSSRFAECDCALCARGCA